MRRGRRMATIAARIRQASGGMSALRRTLGLIGLVAMTGCGDALGPEPEDAEFDASLGIDLGAMTKLPSGVYIQTVTPGTGTVTVAAGSVVTIAYEGWLADGKRFDGSDNCCVAQDGHRLRANEYVPGFTDGLIGMKVGEVRKIVIPSRLGYGDEGIGDDIPGGAVLVFQVTLISTP
jgi:FKBP-type peptidyl-prolyl cis-trans isomerase FkpA